MMDTIVCLGAAILDMFPSEYGKKLVDVPYFFPAPGGAPANVAVAGAKLGAKTAFLGKVGDDIFGHHLAEVFASCGVDVSGMRFDPTACTTMNFHAKPDERTTEYLFYRKPGADTLMRADDIAIDVLSKCKILHCDSLNFTHEPTRSTTLQVLKSVRRLGGLTSFDVNYRKPFWAKESEFADQIMEVLPLIDIVKLNDAELALLTGSHDIERCAWQIIERGPQTVLITLGAEGSWMFCKGHNSFVPSFSVNAIDTIGCGDAFVAGFLTKYTPGVDEKDASRLADLLKYANAVGALTATKKGVIPALPTRKDVETFLRAHS